VEGRSAVITNNRIHNVKSSGVYLRPFVDNRPSSFVVSNNEITHSIGDDTGSADYGIRVYADVSDVDFFDISGNVIRAAIAPLSISMNTGKLIKKLRFLVILPKLLEQVRHYPLQVLKKDQLMETPLLL
jgi:hypothetical protein